MLFSTVEKQKVKMFGAWYDEGAGCGRLVVPAGHRFIWYVAC